MSDSLILPPLRQWARRVIARAARRFPAPDVRRRRALLVHVDGVSRHVLERALAGGDMPFLASAVGSGAYHLDSAFWGAPPSTPVFEASALYGVRHSGIPAYSWYDRGRRRLVRMNAPADATEVEQALSRHGNNLLDDGGTAYLTLFRGGAANRLCMSALTDPGAVWRELRGEWRALLGATRRGPLAKALDLTREGLSALLDGARWGGRLLDWRHERELAMIRVFLLNALAGIARTRAVLDMVRGSPTVYLVEAGFDEVSHRRGPDSPQARRELRRIDAAVANLHAVARSLDAPYDVVLFSDHGQVATTPFEKLTGRTLGDALRAAARAPVSEGTLRALSRGATARTAPSRGEDPVVVEVGNVAHVYLGGDRPLDGAALAADHAPLLSGLAREPRIGGIAVRREDGAVLLTSDGVFSAQELAHAKLPPAYSRRAVAELLGELPHLPHAGDLVLLGAAQQEGTVGFSWDFGSHGGVTRAETDSFVLWPAQGPVQLDGLGHASELNGRLLAAYRN